MAYIQSQGFTAVIAGTCLDLRTEDGDSPACAAESYLTAHVTVIAMERGLFHLVPGCVAAYALGDTESYCKDIINPATGTIDQNYLDTTSDIIGQEFGKLYKLYIKTLRK